MHGSSPDGMVLSGLQPSLEPTLCLLGAYTTLLCLFVRRLVMCFCTT